MIVVRDGDAVVVVSHARGKVWEVTGASERTRTHLQ
jgi:hypothetical protein